MKDFKVDISFVLQVSDLASFLKIKSMDEREEAILLGCLFWIIIGILSIVGMNTF